jgi:hypothetical protein
VILFVLYFLGKYKIIYSGLDFNVVVVNGVEVNVALRQTISLSVLCFSLFSFASSFNICLPINKYRLTVIFSALALAVAFLVVDYFWNSNTRGSVGGASNILNISYEYLQPINYVAALNVFVIVTAIYFLVSYIVKVIKKGAKDD